jgi:hypothetical protein
MSSSPSPKASGRPPVQVQRTQVLFLYVQLERQHRPDTQISGEFEISGAFDQRVGPGCDVVHRLVQRR